MECLDINHEILEVLTVAERELRSHDIVLRTDLDRTCRTWWGIRSCSKCFST